MRTMANTLSPGLQKQINKAVNEHAAAAGKPTAEPSASPAVLKNTPQTTTTQPPDISAQELATAHQTAQAEALAAQQTPDKQVFSLLGDKIEYHQLGSQYLLTVKPLPLGMVVLLVWVALCIALLTGASWLLIPRQREKQKPATQVKRLSLFAP